MARFNIFVDGNLYEGSDNEGTARYLYRTVDETCLRQWNGHKKALVTDAGYLLSEDTIVVGA